MFISVAMCTYNGAKYIKEQLLSILRQELPVNEIVLCDDDSRDNTIAKVHQIANKHSVVNWIINKNSQSLGVINNFGKAISLCSGDFIFLSDQDDIWMPNKVKTIVSFFEKNPGKDVVFTNGVFIDEFGQGFTEKTMFDAVSLCPSTIKYAKRLGMSLEVFLVHNRATGATMALRKSFIGKYNLHSTNAVKPGDVYHDHIIALAAAAQNKLGIIDEPLIKYRIHGNQSVGFGSWIKNPPASHDIYTVSHSLKFVEYIPNTMKERAKMLTDRYFYKKSILHFHLFRYFYRYIQVYGYMLGSRIWFHDVLNAVLKKSSIEW